MSSRRQKKSDHQVDRLTSYINLIVAILNLIVAILLMRMNS